MTLTKSEKARFDALRAEVSRGTPEEAARVVMRAGGREAAALIFEHPDPESVMAVIPAESAYLLIKQLGEDDALELLELATDEQVQALFDIDCWDKDRLRLDPSRKWFHILAELPDDRFIRAAKRLDLAFFVLFFKRHMEVERFDELIDWNLPESPNLYMPPDRRHVIKYQGKEALVRFVHELSQKIYRLDVEFYYHVLEAIYWEIGSQLEEDAYETRTARLSDMGFPDYYSAIEVFAPCDPEKFRPRKKIMPKADDEDFGEQASRERFLEVRGPDNLLRRVLAREFPERDAVIREIMALANMVSVAERVAFADIERVRDVVQATSGYLNIGIEHLAERAIDAATTIVRERRLVDVYRIGRSLVTRLGKRAGALIKLAATDRKTTDALMLPHALSGFVRELTAFEPRRVDGEGTARLFGDLSEVEAASETLARIERFVRLFHDELGITPEVLDNVPMLGLNHDREGALNYRTLFCTAYANDALGRELAPQALHVEDLPKVYERFDLAGRKRHLNETARAQFKEWLDARGAADLWPMFDELFERLADELAVARKSTRPDVRYIGSLIIEIPY
ncbi:DUF6178 family protein [bacterium]|nr:DUF6178 family protein [bacterium]